MFGCVASFALLCFGLSVVLLGRGGDLILFGFVVALALLCFGFVFAWLGWRVDFGLFCCCVCFAFVLSVAWLARI